MNEPKTVAPQRHQLLTEAEIIAASEARGPIKCGIYFLIKDSELKYVGKSINIEARLGAHRPRGFDRWHWIPCLPEELDHLERRYIDEFLPPWNSDPLTAKRRGDPKARANALPLLTHPLEGIDPDWHVGSNILEEAEADYEYMRDHMRQLRAMRNNA